MNKEYITTTENITDTCNCPPTPGPQIVEMWLAKDDTPQTGHHSVCLFRHEPALSYHGHWWCHETDEPNGGRYPIEELIQIKQGEKMKVTISACTAEAIEKLMLNV